MTTQTKILYLNTFVNGLEEDKRKYFSLATSEDGIHWERPRIACVFYNRLKAKPMWRLETDPTVIYAAILEDRYDGVINRSDLDNKHPYNTYQHPGLPPGPIANPGRAALQATLQPADTDYIFFVAAPDASAASRAAVIPETPPPTTRTGPLCSAMSCLLSGRLHQDTSW